MLSLHDELPIFAVTPRPAFAAPCPVPCLMAACLMAASLVGGSAQAHTAGSTGYAEVTVDGGTVSYGLSLAVDTLAGRSEEHTSELQSLMRISYAVFCLKKKK